MIDKCIQQQQIKTNQIALNTLNLIISKLYINLNSILSNDINLIKLHLFINSLSYNHVQQLFSIVFEFEPTQPQTILSQSRTIDIMSDDSTSSTPKVN